MDRRACTGSSVTALLAALALVTACAPNADAPDGAKEPATAFGRPLIAPHTPSQTARLDFDGVILTVPKALAAHARVLENTDAGFLQRSVAWLKSLLPKSGADAPPPPIKTNMVLGFSFWYPDMTLGRVLDDWVRL